MTGSKRREELINTIKSSTSPISGKTLAQLYDVSRQVIVQDIALLRTAGYDIISTNRGYILNAPHTITEYLKLVTQMLRQKMNFTRLWIWAALL